jgi:hypothetical protein
MHPLSLEIRCALKLVGSATRVEIEPGDRIFFWDIFLCSTHLFTCRHFASL